MHVRSHIGDTTYYPPVAYHPPVARRPEPLAPPRPGRPSAPNPGASYYDYETLVPRPPSYPPSDYVEESPRQRPSLDYNELVRNRRGPGWDNEEEMDEQRDRYGRDEQWRGRGERNSQRSFRRSSPQRRSYRRQTRSRSSSDDDDIKYVPFANSG